MERMTADLAEIQNGLEDGVAQTFNHFVVAKQRGQADEANAQFVNLLCSLGELQPLWSNVNDIQDSSEFLEVLLSEIKDNITSQMLPDVITTQFSCEAECQT